jgi:hypothetical protein
VQDFSPAEIASEYGRPGSALHSVIPMSEALSRVKGNTNVGSDIIFFRGGQFCLGL